MKKVYLDNAATTRVHKEVVSKMAAVLSEHFGNPSSTHSFGRSPKTMIESARKTIAKELNAHASEIVFTSGGTEADNMVLRGAVRDLGVKKIVTSKIEHHAILHTAAQLQQEYGIDVKFVILNKDGSPNLEHLESILAKDDDKKLVSFMHVNNEIGTKLDLKAIAHICKRYEALLHSDTVQSIGHFKWDVQEIPIDFMAASAHKFHGPKGVGFAYIRKDTGLKPLIFGGEQERGYRAGTESIHNIIGLETAFVMAYEHLGEEQSYIQGLKDYFIEKIQREIPETRFNGVCEDAARSTYTIVSVRLPFSEEQSQLLLFNLDLKGIACSKGSACQSGSITGSHVLQAVLTENELKKPSLRFSFSKYNTREEVDYVVSVLRELLNK